VAGSRRAAACIGLLCRTPGAGQGSRCGLASQWVGATVPAL